MEEIDSLKTDVDRLGEKIERIQRAMKLKEAGDRIQSTLKLKEAEDRRQSDPTSQVLPTDQKSGEAIPMGPSRIEESEKIVVAYQEVKLPFEDERDRAEEELLFASCTLLKLHRRLDDVYDGEERKMGRLDKKVFFDACSRRNELHENKIREQQRSCLNKELESTTLEESNALYTYWQTQVFDAYDNALELEEEEIPFKPYDEGALEKVKEKYGLEIYRAIRKGFHEIRVASRTGVLKKPWNGQQAREATLNELLVPLPDLAYQRRQARQPRNDY